MLSTTIITRNDGICPNVLVIGGAPPKKMERVSKQVHFQFVMHFHLFGCTELLQYLRVRMKFKGFCLLPDFIFPACSHCFDFSPSAGARTMGLWGQSPPNATNMSDPPQKHDSNKLVLPHNCFYRSTLC